MGTYNMDKELLVVCDYCSDTIYKVPTEKQVSILKYATIKVICDECRDKYHVKLEFKKDYGR